MSAAKVGHVAQWDKKKWQTNTNGDFYSVYKILHCLQFWSGKSEHRMCRINNVHDDNKLHIASWFDWVFVLNIKIQITVQLKK